MPTMKTDERDECCGGSVQIDHHVFVVFTDSSQNNNYIRSRGERCSVTPTPYTKHLQPV